MGPYFALLRVRLALLFTYRAAAFAGLFTQVFWALVYVMILKAFYGSASHAEPLSLKQAVAFVWIGQSLVPLLPWTIDREVEAQIRSGHVAYELIRPLHLYRLWFVHCFGLKLFPALIRGTPVICIGIVFGGLEPASLLAFCGFLASVFLGLFVASAMATCIVVSLFWTLTGDGIRRIVPSVAVLLSGLIVPLPLFPDWMQPILDLQPFRCLFDIPCRLYTGVIPIEQLGFYLLFQLIWALLLIWLGKSTLARAMKLFVIQGG